VSKNHAMKANTKNEGRVLHEIKPDRKVNKLTLNKLENNEQTYT